MIAGAVATSPDEAQARVFLDLLREDIVSVGRRLEDAEILGYHARKHRMPVRAARFGAEIATLRAELAEAQRLVDAIVRRFPDVLASAASTSD
ncbi:hypothetical protein [Rhodococcus koreensis]